MDLLLWRHAEAVDGTPDHARELSARGARQARRVAEWLDAHRPEGLRVLVSPTTRTRQTARAFTDEFEIVPALRPDAGAAELLAAAGWPRGRGACVVVGHQPTIGRAAALLMSGAEADWSIRKGALWWVAGRVRDGKVRTVLRAVVSPDFL